MDEVQCDQLMTQLQVMQQNTLQERDRTPNAKVLGMTVRDGRGRGFS